VLALAVTAVPACSWDERPPFLVHLGEHRFRVGDDPRFADPELDDSDWKAGRAPSSWTRFGFGDQAFAWYRMRFDLPAGAPREGLAIELGVIAWADEVFLNGTRIGGTGSLRVAPDIAFIPRAYRLPAAALRETGNLLAIRVRGGLGHSGLLDGELGIGEAWTIAAANGRRVGRTVATEAALMGVLLFGWVALAFLPRRGRIGRATLLLWLSVTMQLVHLWLFSLTARHSGLTLGAGSTTALAATRIGVAAMWGFISVLLTGRIARPLLVAMVVMAALSLGAVGGSDWLRYVILASLAVGTAGNLMVLLILVRAVRARTPGGIPLLLGSLAYAGTVGVTLLAGRLFLSGVLVTYYGLGLLAGAALLALIQQVRQMSRQAQQSADYALEAHTRERTRLARDLHDGLGQMLALLKLHLQRVGKKLTAGERGSLDEGVGQVDATIDELRRIARDLRPAPMQDRGFGEAVRDYAAAVNRRADLVVEVEGDFAGPLREGVGDELYRIVQECLTNCLKHSLASRVTVRMHEDGVHHVLTVSDDGRGLRDGASMGLGLQTIRERSQLLGGRCTIGPGPRGGTSIEVSIPR